MSVRIRKVLAWTVVVAASLGVFALYTRPAMMVTLADFIWACFN
jgi:hypothetical protein